MASTTLEQNLINNGRRNILQPQLNPTPYNTPTTYTRPSDWTALPTVADTYYATGIYAVYDQSSNYVAFNCTVTVPYLTSSDGTIQGTTLTFSTPGGTLNSGIYTGQSVTGTGVAAGTYVTSVNSSIINGSFDITTSTLTITSMTGDPIVVGTAFYTNAVGGTKYVSAFLTGTGGTGTYTCVGGGGFNGTLTSRQAISATVNISQTVNTLISPASLTLTANYQVDWGDGVVDIVNTAVQAQHNYVYSSVPGVVCSRGYKTAAVTINAYGGVGASWNTNLRIGTANFNVRYTPTSGTLNNYTARWLDMSINLPGEAFVINSNSTSPLYMLEQITVPGPAEQIVTFNSTFANLRSLQNVVIDPNIQITDMTSMFSNSGLISAPALSTTNTSVAILATTMFNGCTSLLYCPDYYLPSVTNINGMFTGCTSLEVAPTITTTTALTDPGTMFSGCTALRVVKAPTNTTNIVSTSSMFFNCVSLTSDNVPFFDTGNVTNFISMFNGCSGLTTVPLYNTSKATNTTSMFNGCVNLVSVPLFNFTNVATFTNAFSSCSSLTTIPQFNMSNVTTLANAFSNTTNLVTIANINTINCTNFTNTFANSGIKVVPNINTSNATNMAYTFSGTSRLLDIPTINTSKVANMSNTFSNSSIISIPAFDTSNVTDMSSMFANSKVQTIANLNTSNVTNAYNMCNAARSLSSMPPIDTSKVNNAASMFQTCSSLTNLPTLNLVNCTSTISFANSSGFNSLNFANLGTNAVANFSTMFQVASSLVDISNINLGNVAVAAATLTFVNTPSLSKLSNVSNARFTFTVATCSFGKTEMESIFANTLIPVTTAQTISISSNPGTDIANAKTSGTTAGSNVVTMANTVGVLTGTFLYGTGMNTGIPVTFNDAANTVVYTNGGGLNGLANGDMVRFTAITTTTGIVINTTYYVVGRTSTTFQVSTAAGGAAINLVTNGTGVMTIGGATISNQVVTVNANANVIISGVCGITNAAATLTARNLNTNQAIGKGWTVSG